MQLLTIPLSHYCERARWALDWCRVPYREERHLQGFHLRAVRRAGGKHTVPLLVTPSGPLLDSADIVAYASDHAPPGRALYPDAERDRAAVLDLERAFAGDLGVEVRRWAYFRLLPERRLLLRYNGSGAPRHQRLALWAGFPYARRVVTRYLRIDADRVERGLGVIARHMDAVGEQLADGRPFLTGERFTAADLSFAAMAALLVFPPEYGVPLPEPGALPAEPRAEVEAWRRHPAGDFVLRLYRSQRRGPTEPCP